MRRVLLFAALALAAPAGAQTCSDGTTGVRVAVSRTEVLSDGVRVCLSLVGDPARRVGHVFFNVFERGMYFVGEGTEAAAPSVYNTAPYSVTSARCLASPMCDDHFIVMVARGPSGTPASFTAAPEEAVCHRYVAYEAETGIAVRNVSVQDAAGAAVPVCAPGDQAAWGAVVAAEGAAAGAAFALEVGPNPVRGSARVAFTLPEAGVARVAVYDALGREAAVLWEGARPAGAGEVALDAAALAPGAYVVRLEAGGAVAARRVAVVR